MKARVSCVRERVDVLVDGPAELWAWWLAHTTPRVEPKPGIRQEVEVHNTHCELENGMKLW